MAKSRSRSSSSSSSQSRSSGPSSSSSSGSSSQSSGSQSGRSASRGRSLSPPRHRKRVPSPSRSPVRRPVRHDLPPAKGPAKVARSSSYSSSSGSDSGGSTSSTSSSSGESARSRGPSLKGRRRSPTPPPRRSSPPRQARGSPDRRKRRSPTPPPRRDARDGRRGERGGSRADRSPVRGRVRSVSPVRDRGGDRDRHRREEYDRRRDPPKRRSSPDRRPGPGDERSKRARGSPDRPRSRERRADRSDLPGPPPRRETEGGSRGGQRGGFSDGDGRGGRGSDREVGKWRSKEADQPGKEVWGPEGNRAPTGKKEEVKVEPNFGLSGALAEETNKVAGVSLVYTEPPEAAHASLLWRLYTFKGGEQIGKPIHIHRQTHYLFGRERKIADISTDHPSCSKQHAVLQYRRTSKEGPDGMPVEGVRPYLMDLASTNGTFINGERLEPQRYYELLEQDVLKLGNSTREYVLLHEGSLGH